MNRAGAGVPSPDRITLLRDADGDGVAESRSTFISGLHSPFGMALVGDAVRREYRRGTAFSVPQRRYPPSTHAASTAGAARRRLNHHWTKNLIAG